MSRVSLLVALLLSISVSFRSITGGRLDEPRAGEKFRWSTDL